LRLLRRRVLFILLSVVAGVGGAYLVTPRGSTYQTNAVIYVGSKNLQIDNGQLTNQASGVAQIASTFAAMIPSIPIAQKAVQLAGVTGRPPAVAVAETKSQVIPTTNLILVTVTDPDPAMAQKLANGMSEAFVEEIKSFEAPAPVVPGYKPSPPASVFEQAPLPFGPLPRNTSRNLIIGALFGLVLSVTVVLLLNYLDVTVRSPEDVERRTGLPVLGSIPLQRQVGAAISPVVTPRRPLLTGRSRG
jgi:receptor protein-tyrosine kinase